MGGGGWGEGGGGGGRSATRIKGARPPKCVRPDLGVEAGKEDEPERLTERAGEFCRC